MRNRRQEFRITHLNKFEVLTGEDQHSVDVPNDNLTRIPESAVAVGGREPIKETGKLCQKTKDLIEKRRKMKASSPMEQVELADLTKIY